MVAKSISLSCPECGSEYTITSTNWESIQYCPFCGEVFAFDDVSRDVDEDDDVMDMSEVFVMDDDDDN